jgi:predicted DNA-binding protein YlxM (UPF0122 family)
MSENSKNSVNNLIKGTEKLLKRFNEQKGIINAYIKKERNGKKISLLKQMKSKSLKSLIQS